MNKKIPMAMRLFFQYFYSTEWIKLGEWTNMISLTFKQQELEEEYQKNMKKTIQGCFRLIQFQQFAMSLSIFIMRWMRNDTSIYSIMRLIQSISCLGVLAVDRTYFKKVPAIRWIQFVQLVSISNSLMTILAITSSINIHLASELSNYDYLIFEMSQLFLGYFLQIFAYIYLAESWLVQTTILLIIFVAPFIYLSYFYLMYSWFLIISVINGNQQKKSVSVILQRAYAFKDCKKCFDSAIPLSIFVIQEKNPSEQLIRSESSMNLIHQSDQESCFEQFNLAFHNKFLQKQFLFNGVEEIINKILQIKLSNSKELRSVLTNMFRIRSKSIQCSIDENIISKQDEQQEYFGKYQVYLYLNLYIFQQGEAEMQLQIILKNCYWDGKPSVLILINDISESLKIQHYKDMNIYKDRLLATVSHDLKTPLNSIQLSSDMINQTLSPKKLPDMEEKLQQLNDDIQANSQLLQYMINDLLDLSQINNQKLRLVPQYFKFSNIVQDIQRVFDKSIKLKNLNFIWNIQFQDTIFTDPIRLKQILFNLIGNAIKFTFSGYIKVQIEEINELVQIIVEDTGIGISEELQLKLFQVFSTFNPDNINQHGIGLGLNICQALVNIMGPKQNIQLDSSENRGSKFQFVIYKYIFSESINFESDKYQALPPSLQMKSRKNMQNSISETFRVLVVDDTPFNILALKSIIQKMMNCEFYQAFNGQQGIDLLINQTKKNLPIKATFMDINMPVMDGYNATRIIREKEKEGIIVRHRIFIVSAYCQEKDRLHSLEVGADKHLDKPVKVSDLRELLENYTVW